MRHIPIVRWLSALLLLGSAGCASDAAPDAAGSAVPSGPSASGVSASGATPALAASAHPAGADTDSQVKTKALALVAHLAAGKFADAVAMFDAPMRKALPEDQAAAIWKQLTDQLGAYKSAEVASLEHKDAFIRVIVTGEFEKSKLSLIVVFEASGLVTGFFSKPYELPWAAPSYARADSFSEEQVTVGEGEWALPGTLTLPKGDAAVKLPAIVLVHGSGPNDRDETAGATRLFKDLAWGLASRGIAVLRYEKVTRVHGPKVVKQWGNDITLARETIDDALKGAQLLRKHARIDPKKVVYLGHSQGALAAPRAGKLDSTLAGLIIMAAPTRPLEDVGLSQVEYIATIAGPNGEGAKAMLPTMREAVKLVKSSALTATTATEKLPLGIPAPFWLDLRGYKPEQVAAGLKMPVLVLQGEADYQVTMEDFAGWQKGLTGKANATTKSYPGLLHPFTDCGCKLATPDDYAKPGNASPAVIDDIEKWVKAL